jgi:hypothetical protein
MKGFVIMAVNSLIDPKRKIKETGINIEEQQTISTKDITISQYAKAFVNSLDDDKRVRFKKMIESGIKCGTSIAKLYNIPIDKFIAEVKKII